MNSLRIAASSRRRTGVALRGALRLAATLLVALLIVPHSTVHGQDQGTSEQGATRFTTTLAASSSNGAKALSGWDAASVYDPVVIKDGIQYRMWYSGWDLNHAVVRVGYATSSDGIEWTKYEGNPVLDLGTDGAWDDQVVRVNAVIKDAGIYKMWYTGNYLGIGYGTSTDGVHWLKYAGNPVLAPGPSPSWDEDGIFLATVLKDGNGYRMWYSGNGGTDNARRIGYATSADGMLWAKSAANPVLDVGTAGWDAAMVIDPFVISDGVDYTMWYSGLDKFPPCPPGAAAFRVGMATSTDGISWNKSDQNPILDVDPTGWDRWTVTAPWVIYESGAYHMWYHGGVPCSGPEMIGYATSTNGISWTKYAGNPVLRPSQSGTHLPLVLR